MHDRTFSKMVIRSVKCSPFPAQQQIEIVGNYFIYKYVTMFVLSDMRSFYDMSLQGVNNFLLLIILFVNN